MICIGLFPFKKRCQASKKHLKKRNEPADVRYEGKSEEGANTSSEQSTVEEPEEAKAFITLNGQKVYIGLTYADIKESLGDEIKPSEEILPCGDDGGDWKRVLHFYPGTIVTEDQNGIICEVSINMGNEGEAEALVMGQVKLGGNVAELRDLMEGTPVREDEWGATYKYGDAVIQFSATEENGDVLGSIGLMRGSDYGF